MRLRQLHYLEKQTNEQKTKLALLQFVIQPSVHCGVKQSRVQDLFCQDNKVLFGLNHNTEPGAQCFPLYTTTQMQVPARKAHRERVSYTCIATI